MIPLSLAEIADVVGGTLHDATPSTVVDGPAFLDSRTPEAGGLFAAFVGEHVDGHRFAADVVAGPGGAAAVLGSRPTGVPTVVVADVRAALQRLATEVLRRRREQGPLSVLAITGSQGKTSVKDLLAAVLAAHGETVATKGSFNNELGLPLTVLRVTADTRHLVLEMGARGIGHLQELCAIAPPDISIVLNVGKAHLSEFRTQAGIAQAKGELVEALGPGGVAVLNADDPLVSAMASRTVARVSTFGTGAGADVVLGDVRLDDLGRPAFTLQHHGESVEVALQLLGAHQAINAAAAAAAALAAGLSLEATGRALAEVGALSRWRMELHERADGLVVVNDAYNANPDSMVAALRTLAEIGRRSGRRTVAVLGEMRELGPDSHAEHEAVGRAARDLGIDVVVTVGHGAQGIHGWADTSVLLGSVDEAVAWMGENVSGEDAVLVKASRAAGLEKVAEALLDAPDAPDKPDDPDD